MPTAVSLVFPPSTIDTWGQVHVLKPEATLGDRSKFARMKRASELVTVIVYSAVQSWALFGDRSDANDLGFLAFRSFK